MKKVTLGEMSGSTYFSEPVFLDSGYILSSPDVPISQSLKNRLAEWGFQGVFTEGSPVENPPLGVGDATAEPGENSHSYEEEQDQNQANGFFTKIVTFLEEEFERFKTKEELRITSFTDNVKEIISEIRDNKRFMLSLDDADSPGTTYLSTHSAKTAILALALADYMKLPSFKQIDVGLAGMLHNIGLLKIPDELYLSDRTLSAQEKRTLLAHPVLGFRLLKTLGFPNPACLAVLEHNERMDGSGLPRKISGDKISLFGRIIAVASSYNAATSSRPYKSGIDGHAGLIDLLQDPGKRYDEKVLAALVYTLSLYPIGTYIKMTNGAIGVVVKPNDKDPRHPLIRLIIDENGSRYVEQPVVQTRDGDEIGIDTSLSKEELLALTTRK